MQLFEDEYEHEDEDDITKTEEDTLLPPRRAGIFDGTGSLLILHLTTHYPFSE
jgi:hypothetical protein